MKNYFKRIKGRILYVENNIIVKSAYNRIFISLDSGINWDIVKKISSKEWSFPRMRLVNRLLRRGVHHLEIMDNGNFSIVYNKSVLIKSPLKEYVEKLSGSRPLSLECALNGVVFGEYKSNSKREPINIYKFSENEGLTSVALLHGIRHVHGVYKDPYEEKLWFTTGDSDEESYIGFTTDGFKSTSKVLSGSQQTRAIKMLFTEHYIYFGSDTPTEANYIYRLNRSTLECKSLCCVGGPVFHGCKVGSWLFLSTSVEPMVDRNSYVEIWASRCDDDWRKIYCIRKDIFPMKLFQYGQIYFPNGNGDNKNLWISHFATAKDNVIEKFSLNEVELAYSENRLLS